MKTEDDWVKQNGFCYLIPSGMPQVSIRTVYLFYEKTDVSKNLSGSMHIDFHCAALVIVGILPSSEAICSLGLAFKDARFRTLFGCDLPAIVLTCKISLWLKCLDATFLVFPYKVIFSFKSVEFSCAESLFSLNRFCKITGFRTSVRHLRICYKSIS